MSKKLRISLGIAMLLLAVAALVNAWKVQANASAMCQNGTSTISGTFENVEPAGSDLDMYVTMHTSHGSDGPKLVRVGETVGFSVSTEGSIESGEATFEMTWANGKNGTDYRTVSYNATQCAGVCDPSRTETIPVDERGPWELVGTHEENGVVYNDYRRPLTKDTLTDEPCSYEEMSLPQCEECEGDRIVEIPESNRGEWIFIETRVIDGISYDVYQRPLTQDVITGEICLYEEDLRPTTEVASDYDVFSVCREDGYGEIKVENFGPNPISAGGYIIEAGQTQTVWVSNQPLNTLVSVQVTITDMVTGLEEIPTITVGECDVPEEVCNDTFDTVTVYAVWNKSGLPVRDVVITDVRDGIPGLPVRTSRDRGHVDYYVQEGTTFDITAALTNPDGEPGLWDGYNIVLIQAPEGLPFTTGKCGMKYIYIYVDEDGPEENCEMDDPKCARINIEIAIEQGLTEGLTESGRFDIYRVNPVNGKYEQWIASVWAEAGWNDMTFRLPDWVNGEFNVAVTWTPDGGETVQLQILNGNWLSTNLAHALEVVVP